MKKILLTLMLLLLTLMLVHGISNSVFAAVGCDLNDPDRDVKRLFPASTGYRTAYLSISKSGGEPLFEQLQTRLGDKFTGLFETIDVPYTVYTILKGKEIIGYIHGVNQRGQYGGMQVFLVLDTKGTILDFYMQRLTSKDTAMRSKEFGSQFKGLSLTNFNSYNPVKRTGIPSVINPREDNDFFAVLRAVKKNLILMDIFIFSNKDKK